MESNAVFRLYLVKCEGLSIDAVVTIYQWALKCDMLLPRSIVQC